MPVAKSLCLEWQVELKNGAKYEVHNREQIRAFTMHVVRCARCRMQGQLAAEQRDRIVQDVRRSIRGTDTPDVEPTASRPQDSGSERLTFSALPETDLAEMEVGTCTCGESTPCRYH